MSDPALLPFSPTRALTPLFWPVFPEPFRYSPEVINAIRTPGVRALQLTIPVHSLLEDRFLFLFLRLLDVSVHRVPSVHLSIQCAVVKRYAGPGLPFRNLRINGYVLLPRSLSQLITSFIGSSCQASPALFLA